MPMMLATSAADTPTASDTRAGMMICNSTLRPSSSVPNGSLSDGGRRISVLIASGSGPPKTTAPPIAMITSARMIAALTQASGIRRRRVQLSDCPGMTLCESRIDHAANDIGQQVDENRGKCRNEEDSVEHRVVPLRDRVDEQRSEPRPGENRLEHDGPG